MNDESIKTPPETPEPVSQQIAVRQTYTQKVIALFKSRPLEWLTVQELAQVGGFAAWRSRISDARQILEAEGGTLEWNHKIRLSAYRWLPYRKLGRDSAEPDRQPELF